MDFNYNRTLTIALFHKRPIRDVYIIYLISFEARELPLDGGHHSISCWDNVLLLSSTCEEFSSNKPKQEIVFKKDKATLHVISKRLKIYSNSKQIRGQLLLGSLSVFIGRASVI